MTTGMGWRRRRWTQPSLLTMPLCPKISSGMSFPMDYALMFWSCLFYTHANWFSHMLNLKAGGLLGPDLTSKWNKSATKFNMDFATWSQRLDPTKYLLPSKTLKSCHHQRLNHTCTQQDTWQTTTWCTTLTQCKTPQDTIGNNTFQHNAIKRQILDVLLQLPCHICCIENLYIHHFFGQVKLLRFLNLVVL